VAALPTPFPAVTSRKNCAAPSGSSRPTRATHPRNPPAQSAGATRPPESPTQRPAPRGGAGTRRSAGGGAEATARFDQIEPI